MRKNYIPLVFLLLLNISMFGQKVTLTPTVVNGANFNVGPINLAGVPYSTISLGVKVEVPSNIAVGDQGTIKIYFSKGLALGGNVAIGGDGGALYFGGGKIAARNFVINLNWTDFLTAGGFIYAEYKSGTSYKSSNIAVVKNATMTTGTTLNPPADAPNPKQIVNTLCCNQTIRVGDKPAPITGSQYLNPYNNLPYGINSQWVNTSNGESPKLDDINRILYFDYTTELKNITVYRKLGYVYGGEFPNKSNDITITVVPSPILTNQISINAPVNSSGFFEITNTNPKRIDGTVLSGQVNLNILQDPYHVVQRRGDIFKDIERFEWEYTKTSAGSGGFQNWITISGQNDYFLDFTPSDISSTEDNYYILRRIAIYQNIKRVSNTLNIVYRTIRNDNTICCDQKLKITSTEEIEKPSLITGSIAVPTKNSNLYYQWQKLPINNRDIISKWENILGATSKDYMPLPLQYVSNTGRSSIQYYAYRRIAQANYYKGETSYSNEINISRSYERTPSPSSTIIYPNPATSIINIE
ncbi:MAG: T9SS C-terminal target domain-containing protein, partial [Flavobacterium sp.]